MALPATVGTPVPITMILEDGVQSQYPQAEIYAAGGTSPIATIDLPHKAKGRYEASWTPTSPGTYSAHFFVYSDAGHTVENITYTREIEHIFATDYGKDDLAAMLLRVLGMVHENAFIDNTIHDVDGQLIAARVRIFDSKANVEAATDGGTETTGLIAVYEMSTVYESKGQMGNYRMKRVQ
jgi:hypothetical protein